MGKKILDSKMDAYLTSCRGTHIAICTAEPLNFADIANVDLVNEALVGSHTLADGDTSGRKNTTPGQTGKSIIASGLATHIVEHDNVSDIGKITTISNSQTLTSGGTADTNPYDHEIQDPT